MVLLSTFGNEFEAQIIASRLKESGIDHKVETKEGESECSVFVFEDDLEEAREIIESRSFEDDGFLGDLNLDDLDLDGLDDIDGIEPPKP